MIEEKIIPCPEGVVCVPLHAHEQVEWGFNRVGGDELRIIVDNKVPTNIIFQAQQLTPFQVIQVIEGASCTCATFADSSHLITGSSDHIVRLWKFLRGNSLNGSGALTVTLSHIMRFHTDKVICVAASRIWSAIVSASEDGSAALWDLNRGVYIRSLWHRHDNGLTSPIHLVAINESTVCVFNSSD